MQGESIFDMLVEQTQTQFWVNPTPDEQQKCFSEEILYSTKVFRKGKKKRQWKTKNIFLCENFLYLKDDENSTNIIKILYFDINVRVEFYSNTRVCKDMDHNIFPYSFLLVKKQFNQTFFTHDTHANNQFKIILGERLLQHTFHEDYSVIKMIGKGSFAKVYLAKKKENNSLYAIKAFSKQTIMEQKKGLKSLANEVSLMRQLQHKNILKLHEVFETAHSIYMVLALITGGDLNQKEKSIARYSQIQILIKRLLEAIAYIHSKHIMHRDLKLENILILSDKENLEPIIVDFGLATNDNIPIENVLFKRCGTPGFVAPEVLAFKDDEQIMYTNKCDVFSIGIIFYCLLTRKKPFNSKDCKQLIQQNKQCKINFFVPELLNSPESAQELVKKLLAVSIEKRPSATEALKDSFFQETFPENEDKLFEVNQIASLKQQKKQLDKLFEQKLKGKTTAQSSKTTDISSKPLGSNQEEQEDITEKVEAKINQLNQTQQAKFNNLQLKTQKEEIKHEEHPSSAGKADKQKKEEKLTKIPLQDFAQNSFLYQNEVLMRGNLNTVQSIAGTFEKNQLKLNLKNQNSIYQIHFQKQQQAEDQKNQEQQQNNQEQEDEDDYIPLITRAKTANLQGVIEQTKQLYNFGLAEIKSDVDLENQEEN